MSSAPSEASVSCGIGAGAPQTPVCEPKAIFRTVSVNAQALSLFRIVFALYLFFDLFHNILPYWSFLYGGEGVLPASERGTNILWSFFSYSDNPVYQGTLLAILAVSLFGMLIGYRARLCTFINFLLFFAIMDRNPQADSNMEVLANALLLWASFLPIDRYYSFDAALRDDSERKRRWPIIMATAIKIQISLVYLYSGLFKISSENWRSGDALKYAVSDELYGTQRGEHALALVPQVLHQPLAWALVLFQIFFSAMVYSPVKRDLFRGLAILGAIFMHLGFILFLQVHMFPYLCFTYLLVLVPDRWLDRLFAGRRARISKIKIYYDPDCGFCRAVSLLLREFCLGPWASVQPASDDAATLALLRKYNSWIVYGHDGKTYMKWEAVSHVLNQSPVFVFLGVLTGLPFLKRPMTALYDLIGDNRYALSKTFGGFLRQRPADVPERMTQYLCFGLIAIMVSYATLTLPQVKPSVNLPIQYVIGVREMGVQQTWDLFAPVVPSWHWHWKIQAWDKDGKKIDLTPILAPQRQWYNGHWVFPGHRVLKFYSRMIGPENNANRRGFARYICQEAAKRGTPPGKVHVETWIQHMYLGGSEPSYYFTSDCKF